MRKVETKHFQNISQAVKSIAKRFDENADVILFGSRAKGNYTNESDWDFLILLDVPIDYKLKEEIRANMFDIELKYNITLFCLIENRKEWEETSFLEINRNVASEGILI